MCRELLRDEGGGDGCGRTWRHIWFGVDGSGINATSKEAHLVTATLGERCWKRRVVILIKEMDTN